MLRFPKVMLARELIEVRTEAPRAGTAMRESHTPLTNEIDHLTRRAAPIRPDRHKLVEHQDPMLFKAVLAQYQRDPHVVKDSWTLAGVAAGECDGRVRRWFNTFH